MEKTVRCIIMTLCIFLYANCSGPASSDRAASGNAMVTVLAGKKTLIQANQEFSEYILYQGKLDSIAIIGYAKEYRSPLSTLTNDPRKDEEDVQYVSAVPGTVFYLRQLDAKFELILCDEKALVVRVR